MFKFHLIGNKVAKGWLCLIDSEEALMAHLEYMGQRVWKNWVNIKDSPNYKDGHCRTNEASVYKGLLWGHIEDNGYDSTIEDKIYGKVKTKKMSMPDSISYLSNISTQSAIKVFLQNGEVYVSRTGACRPSTKLLECESILDKAVSKDYVFPVKSKKDLRIQKWVGGNHYYIMENGCSISIDNQVKWNTVDSAQDASVKTIFSYIQIIIISLCIVAICILSNSLIFSYISQTNDQLNNTSLNELGINISLCFFIIILMLINWKQRIMLIIYSIIAVFLIMLLM